MTKMMYAKRAGSILLFHFFLLITNDQLADHMPFAGAARDLGKAFGFDFVNGFAFTGENSWPPSVFSLVNGTLKKTPVTNELNAREAKEKSPFSEKQPCLPLRSSMET